MNKTNDLVYRSYSCPFHGLQDGLIFCPECHEARPAPKPSTEWDGEGLPPVGCECEFSVHTFGKRTEFQRCEFLARNESHGVSWVKTDDDFEVVYDSDQPRFRPIRTKEQREREALSDLIGNNILLNYSDGRFDIEIGEAIDAIIAAGWHK